MKYLSFLIPLCLASPLLAANGDRPNILFIIADDQSPFDLKAYDPKSTLNTPVLDKLAADGMVFDGAYQMGAWSGAVCTPSRHMIMSGRTLWHIPGRHPLSGDPKLVPTDLPSHTMAAVFNDAGYDTMRTCKQGNSYAAANKLFTVVRDATKRGGTDESGSAWHSKQVLDYLHDRERTKESDPFLIYFGFSHPHDTRDGKPELLARYGAANHTDKNVLPATDPKQPPLPANYLSAHPFNNTHMNVRDEVAVSGVWKNRDERTIRNEIGREFACSENIDIQIGRVLDQLKAMGELENTYIVYTADHGMAIGRHGLQGKQNLYEHTWRVPFIVKGPGIKPGSRAVGNIYLLDVLATLCDLAKIEAPKTSEGISFKPVLDGNKETVRDVLYGAYSGGAKPGIRCVKQGDWKLIQYESAQDGASETQLFNLADNPNELLKQHHDPKIIALTGVTPTPCQINLANDTQHAAKRKEMEQLLLAEMRRYDDPYRFTGQPNASQNEAEPTKPNIVFIFADDWGWGDLSSHGHAWLKTPNIDRLASEGTDFLQFNVLNPVCSPSRVAAMTGQFPARYAIHQHFAAPASNHQRNMPDWLDPKAPTLPRFLKEAGYRTGHFGKWHLSNAQTPGAPIPEKYGIDDYAVFNGGAGWPVAGLHDTASNSVDFIKTNRDKPFFINVWLHESHTPHVPTPESMEKWKHLDKQKQVYSAVITDGDNAVGKILDALKTEGLEKNTIVIFSSDNGPESTAAKAGPMKPDTDANATGYDTHYSIGETGGLRGRKRSLFEGGVRVPLIVRWPGHTPANVKDSTTVITAVDLLPTLCAAAGVELAEDYKGDGENLLDALNGKAVSRTRPIFWEWQGKKAEPDWWPRLAVRDGDWKLVLTYDAKRVELYRVNKDRSESSDAAKEKPEIVDRLTKLALDWKATLPKKPNPDCLTSVPDVKKPRSYPKRNGTTRASAK